MHHALFWYLLNTSRMLVERSFTSHLRKKDLNAFTEELKYLGFFISQGTAVSLKTHQDQSLAIYTFLIFFVSLTLLAWELFDQP